MAQPFYITTPIYYVNAKPHLGHAYTTILADVASRFHKMRGVETFFLTGTDEHGDKIQEAAQKGNMTPRAYVDSISKLFQDMWPELDIENDHFIRTTDPAHIKLVKELLQKIYDSGDIYFSEYEGLYCVGCERFYTERELVDGKCPDHETPPQTIKESNYFFRMSRYQDWLIDHIKTNPDFIRPKRYRNEVLSFLKAPLEDLCISRPKTRLQWGISLPFDENYVTYVWFDALINYLTAVGYPDGERYKKFWPHAQHIVAKDILKPHGIYWPTMLKAAGIPVYQHLNVHGYWIVDKSKMSKTLGNVVEPLAVKENYGIDAFRFFLMRDMVFGLDSSFSEEALIGRINADLANDLGNLFSRVLSMSHKYFDGTVPETDPTTELELQPDLEAAAAAAIAAFEKEMESFAFHKALQAVWVLITRMNKYIDDSAPWALAKKEETRAQLEVVMYHLLEGVRVVSGLIYPFMPGTAERMQKHLGLDPAAPFYLLDRLKSWRSLPKGGRFPKPIMLFPRIDVKKKSGPKEKKPAAVSPAIKPEITLEEFGKIDLRAATVLKAEPVPKSKKLLKLEVDLGEKRTVVAGISGSYTADEMVGKQVIIVANLKPAKLMGVLSSGMVLAAVDKKGAAVASVDKPVKPGTPLK
ncbi:MAG: methionine--tRNA ligase [Desulfobacterales bacterium]|nr:methionine--tRNA ligase [Desulfobacterales bacterium]